jgi:phosphopantothenoylcysteine synthetase/decarboxylase
MQFREEFEVTTATVAGDVTAFFGQNTNALERMAAEFARTLVSAILEAF